MESVLVDAVVGKVLEIAIEQAADEVRIVLNFREDFEKLKKKIRQINYFLDEAEENKNREKESAKEWLRSVRDVAWEVEDMLQLCAVDPMYYSSHSNPNPQLCHFWIFCYLWEQLTLRHQMGRRIQHFEARIRSVVKDGNQLSISRAALAHTEEAESSSNLQRRKYASLSVLSNDSKPVGIESKIESLVSLLEDPRFPIISVVGMGVLEKTYLLQHVYNVQKVSYEKYAWISVSQFYSFHKLLNDLAFDLETSLGKEIKESGISEEAAAVRIHKFIRGQRSCLIVLDDVWRATGEVDLLGKLGIPTEPNGSCKVLVSTRSREVCINLHAKIYEMESLTDEESWKLFCAHAFPETEGNRPPEFLAEVALDIVKVCANLPLAIRTTGASLASITQPGQWRSKLSKLKKVDSPEDPIMDILKLSYDCLPVHLKACFAYLAFFPEDEEIDCDYLTHLWMGEGLIPKEVNPWECLDELESRSLVQVCETGHELRKYCKIHDLLLDLAIRISRENRCAFQFDDAFPKPQAVNASSGPWGRLFLAKKDINEQTISTRRPLFPKIVRTLSLSSNTHIGENIPTMLFSGMRVLRVLDLSWTNISSLPECVGDMKLLQVLNLRKTKITQVPDFVRHLKSLSYLNVSECSELTPSPAPEWIVQLRYLQHLEGKFFQMPKGIRDLESFRTLRLEYQLSLSMGEEDNVLSLEDIGKMTWIEEIGFAVEDESQVRRIEEGILAPLEKMRRLTILNATVEIFDPTSGGWDPDTLGEWDLPQLPESMSTMSDLERLELYHFAPSNWMCRLANLKDLFLWGCDCTHLPEFQELPNLVSLWLEMNASCRELPKAFGKPGGFPKLRFLFIRSFHLLEEFPKIEDGGMACLESVEMWELRNLKKWGGGLNGRPGLRLVVDKFTEELKAAFNEGLSS